MPDCKEENCPMPAPFAGSDLCRHHQEKKAEENKCKK